MPDKGLVPFPGFIGPTYRSLSSLANAEMCMNFVPEVLETPGSRNNMALFGTPGIANFVTSNRTHGRGIFHQDGRAFAVLADTFGEISSNGTFTPYGTVDMDSRPATISSSGDIGNELLITAGGAVFIFDLLANTLTRVPNLSAIAGGHMDGFFIILTDDSRIQISAYADGLTWDPTQFRVRAIGSDKWIAMVIAHREIWLFGTKTLEVWYNAGTSPFPFAPIQGAYHPEGIAARSSAKEFSSGVIWLGSNDNGQGVVMHATQYTPKRVSNHAVENAIQGYVRAGYAIDNAIGSVHEDNGHVFYCLTFPSPDATWVLDNTTGMWHERGKWEQNQNKFTIWRPTFHTQAFGRHLACDLRSGNILRFSSDIYTEADGSEILRIRRTPYVQAAGKNVRFHELRIDVETGLGLQSGQGRDPQMMMRYSNDGAKTWQNKRRLPAGAVGEYSKEISFHKLGASRRRVFEISVSDPIPWRIIGAYIRAAAA